MLRLPLRLSPDQQRALRDNPRQFAKGLRPAIEAGIVEQNIQRLLGALERRLPERLEAEPAGFAAQGWDDAIQQITERVEAILQRRRERLIGPNGAIRREAEERLGRLTLPVPANTAAQLLLASTQSVQASFDKRTHRRLEMRSQRYNLIFLAARRIENQSAEDLIQAILAHLETIRLANQRLWGQSELTRLSAARLVDLDQRSQQRLRVALGVEIAQRAADQPLGTLEPEDRQRLAECLGNLTLNEIYRKLLLGVITDLWIDYLTQMEALRIAITLESYAQRDPLVQYKAKASELYQELIRNTRLGVISRMFLFRPRETSAVQTTSGGVESSEDAPAGSAGNLTSEADAAENAKRKRHRRR
jgi:preprotein translocase subunit SecA